MASVATYLNLPGNTEEAFEFYKSAFGTDYAGSIVRLGDGPVPEGAPPVPDDTKNLIMHITLPILDGHMLMGTDAVESMGFTVEMGNSIQISLMPDTNDEADSLFASLSEGGKVDMPMAVAPWGDYFGAFNDKFGIGWMINVVAYPT